MKLPEERDRHYPFTSGTHTVAEYALLREQGLTDYEIAARWEMRPRAGRNDLRFDLDLAWEQRGSPGEPDQPAEAYEPGLPSWTHWQRARTKALAAWITDQLDQTRTVPCTHCSHHCPGGSLT